MSTAAVGSLASWLLATSAAIGIASSVAAVRGSPRGARLGFVASIAALVGAATAIAAMEIALITHDFSLVYVAENGSRSTPLVYTIASLWAALDGSILLWVTLLTSFVVFAARRHMRRTGDVVEAWTVLISFVVTAWFAFLLIGPANPFDVVSGPVPSDGPGPNPLLQMHPLMAIHPPVLYLGFVGLTVPFARSIAILVTGRFQRETADVVRRETLAAWTFLGAGIVLGAWWSYEVLGWGGFWAWDPVENASLVPWLLATAYLHAVAVGRHRRTMQVSSLGFVCAAFCATILGTFLTRSGVLESVHAFSDSGLGPVLLALFAVSAIASCSLIAWRSEWLRSGAPMDRLLSREGGLFVAHLMLAGFAAVVVIGTLFPVIHEVVTRDRVAVGRPYFDRIVVPLGIATLVWLAIGPRLSWHSTGPVVLARRALLPAWATAATAVATVALGGHGATAVLVVAIGGGATATALSRLVTSVRQGRTRSILGRAGGGAIAHVGFVVLVVAVTASQAWGQRADVRLFPGEVAEVAGHQISYLGSSVDESADRAVLRAEVTIDGAESYFPASTWFTNAAQPIGTPAVRASVVDDVYITIAATPGGSGDPIVLAVAVFPLISWLWIGGAIMALGGAMAIADPTRPRPARPRSDRATDREQVVADDTVDSTLEPAVVS